MLFAKIENDEVVEFPIMEPNLRKALPGTSLPAIITDASLAGTGYVCVDQFSSFEYPEETLTQSVGLGTPVKTENGWERTFVLKDVPEDRIEARKDHKLKEIRAKRGALLRQADAMVARYNREQRMGLPITIDITVLDAYMQELADITENPDPYSIVFPEKPE